MGATVEHELEMDDVYTEKYQLRRKIDYPWKFGLSANSEEFKKVIERYNECCERIKQEEEEK